MLTTLTEWLDIFVGNNRPPPSTTSVARGDRLPSRGRGIRQHHEPGPHVGFGFRSLHAPPGAEAPQPRPAGQHASDFPASPVPAPALAAADNGAHSATAFSISGSPTASRENINNEWIIHYCSANMDAASGRSAHWPYKNEWGIHFCAFPQTVPAIDIQGPVPACKPLRGENEGTPRPSRRPKSPLKSPRLSRQFQAP